MLQIDRVLAIAAVNSLYENIRPGSFVVIDQFIDFTKRRPTTFYEGDLKVVHVVMTEPYCPELRKIIIELSFNYIVRAHMFALKVQGLKHLQE